MSTTAEIAAIQEWIVYWRNRDYDGAQCYEFRQALSALEGQLSVMERWWYSHYNGEDAANQIHRMAVSLEVTE